MAGGSPVQLREPARRTRRQLAEKYSGWPFWDGPTRRMSEMDSSGQSTGSPTVSWLIRFDDEAPTIEAILEKARAAVMRHGIRGLVIDPYNEIEHRRPVNMTETEYVSQLLGKVKRFAQHHGFMSGSSPIRQSCTLTTSSCQPRPCTT